MNKSKYMHSGQILLPLFFQTSVCYQMVVNMFMETFMIFLYAAVNVFVHQSGGDFAYQANYMFNIISYTGHDILWYLSDLLLFSPPEAFIEFCY